MGRLRSWNGLRGVSAGALAGAAGTTAMDLLLYRQYKSEGGKDGFLFWEFSSTLDDWADASAPGLVGKWVLTEVLRREPPDDWARPVQNLVHWATGVGWGAQFGILAGSEDAPAWVWGLVVGPIAWISSYVLLPFIKVYQPIWKYDAKTLAKDLGAHMVYGVTLGAALAALGDQKGSGCRI
jgi:hypothetical protein